MKFWVYRDDPDCIIFFVIDNLKKKDVPIKII